VAVAQSCSDDNTFPVLWMFAPAGRLVTLCGGKCTRPSRAL